MAPKRKKSPTILAEAIRSDKYVKTAHVQTITLPSRIVTRRKAIQDAKNALRSELYVQNAVESPLLRLPRELRDEIWRLLYGDRVIHPYSWGRAHPMAFSVCQGPYSPSSIYSFTLQGASEEDPCRWKAKELDNMDDYCPWNNRNCRLAYYRNVPKPLFSFPLVCRQVWEEVRDIVGQTCIWSFDSADDWKCFLGTKKKGLECIRHVGLRIDFGADYGSKEWAAVLNPFLMKRLPNLQGVDLWLERATKGMIFSLDTLRLDAGTVLNENKQPECSRLRAIVRGLKSGVGKGKGQKRRFRDDRTRVIVHDVSWNSRDRRGFSYKTRKWVPDKEWISVEERLRLARMVKAALVSGD